MKKSLKYITKDNYTATSYEKRMTVSEYSTQIITNSYPVYIAGGLYNSSGTRTSGHAYVIYAYDPSISTFKLKDAWYDSSDITVTYAGLLNFDGGRKVDGTVIFN